MTPEDTDKAPDTGQRCCTGSEHIARALDQGRNTRVRKLMLRMHPAKVVGLL